MIRHNIGHSNEDCLMTQLQMIDDCLKKCLLTARHAQILIMLLSIKVDFAHNRNKLLKTPTNTGLLGCWQRPVAQNCPFKKESPTSDPNLFNFSYQLEIIPQIKQFNKNIFNNLCVDHLIFEVF